MISRLKTYHLPTCISLFMECIEMMLYVVTVTMCHYSYFHVNNFSTAEHCVCVYACACVCVWYMCPVCVRRGQRNQCVGFAHNRAYTMHSYHAW